MRIVTDTEVHYALKAQKQKILMLSVALLGAVFVIVLMMALREPCDKKVVDRACDCISLDACHSKGRS